jgi:hypothetical protein
LSVVKVLERFSRRSFGDVTIGLLAGYPLAIQISCHDD